ncbi:hypothetical protein C0995_010504 [Termitomyces sp. Mi166|nr:hypothetical protein C0995_010504 [Termitomyces sp. Mi166\
MFSRSFQAPYLSLAKFALAFSQPRRSSSEPAVIPSVPDNSSKSLVEVKNCPIDVSSSQAPQLIQQTERSASPTPTEVEEPEPEAILESLKKLNIKVRDFAYPSSSCHTLPPVPENFDPCKGIAEYEYRLRITPHTPIRGKTMRRLLILGWVSMDEAEERLREIDWQALEEYDARNTAYPWYPVESSTVPTAAERDILFMAHAPYFQHFDKIQVELRLEEEWREWERLRGKEAEERAEQYLEENQERERKKMEARLEEESRITLDEQEGPAKDHDDNINTSVSSINITPKISSVSAGKKRPLERSSSTSSFAVSPSTTDGPKRLKLSDDSTAGPSQPPTVPTHPYQQYPAPLQAYDPRLYPDAARVISAENRPSVVLSGRVTPPVSDDESNDGPGVRLQRKKKGLKGLTRTQTFAQL